VRSSNCVCHNSVFLSSLFVDACLKQCESKRESTLPAHPPEVLQQQLSHVGGIPKSEKTDVYDTLTNLVRALARKLSA
jgi:hypothetical protein